MKSSQRSGRALLATAAAALAIAMAVAGCGSNSPADTTIPSGGVRLLLTPPETIGCPLSLTEGDLVPDAAAGVAIVTSSERLPIRWPGGYSGRLDAGQVKILDPAGRVVAQTGTRVQLTGAEIERGVWMACAVSPA